MKIFLIPLSMVALIVVSFSHPSYASESQSTEQNNAILSCDKLAKSESENWSNWASQQGIAKKQLLNYGLNMCLNAVITARDAKSINQIEAWQVDAFNRNVYLGFDVLNVNAVQRSALIAKEYFNSLHGEKNKSSQREITYPELSNSSSEAEKVAALKEYSSKKKINGLPIEKRCELIAKKMPDGSIPSYEVKKNAVLVCEGIMVKNFTNGEHGISTSTAMNIAKKTYGTNSIEYRYLNQVTQLAFSESKH
jgi:hypothetical protein